jgi:hypothetical protein
MEEPYPKPKENLFVINAEENYIVFDPDEGDKWEINETGAFILRSLIEGASLKDIRERMTEKYDLDQGKAEEALQKYIADLREEGILM